MCEQWSMADIHVHTTASDGYSSVSEVLAAAVRTGLHVLAITDHDTIDAAIKAYRIAPAYGIEVIIGEEISTSDGHLLALFLERHVAPGRSLHTTIQDVHAQGGLCIAAHPFDWMVSSIGGKLLARYGQPGDPVALDGVETFNASLPLPGMNVHAARNAGFLPGLGGSDSHHATTVGSGFTSFPGTSAEDLRAAIRSGHTIAGGYGWGMRGFAEYIGLALYNETRSLVRTRLANQFDQKL